MTAHRIIHEERTALRRRNRRIANIIKGFVALVLLAVIGVGIFAAMSGYWEKRDVYTTVVSKERVCDGGSTQGNVDCKYLVFTEDGTFKITDALIGVTRFNSSDVYGRIRPDHCYHLRVYGWRMPAFSSYPNIANVEEIQCPPVKPK